MARSRVVISLFAALLIAATALSFVLSGCKKGDTPPYVLTGNIVVINDCDGEQVSIPDQVRVHAWLNSDRAPNRLGGADDVDLAPDPAKPDAPKKIGTYRISVPWTGMPGNPSTWGRPTVKFNDLEVCETITCAEGYCRDRTTAANVPVNGPVTNQDIRVGCSCGS